MALNCRLFLMAFLVFSPTVWQASIAAQSYDVTQSDTSGPTQPGTSAQKDSTALAVIQQSLHASGGDNWTNIRDYKISAIATQWNFAPRDWPMIICGRSGGGYRVELDSNGPNDSVIEVSDGRRGQFTVSNSSTQILPVHYILSLPIYFPIPFLANLASNPEISLSDKGLVKLDNATARQIDIAQHFFMGSGRQESELDRFTKRSLFFDPDTGYLVQIKDYLYSVRYASSRLARLMIFTNYHTEQGLTYPSVVEEHIGSRVYRAIEMKAIQLNTGLPDAAFALQQDSQHSR